MVLELMRPLEKLLERAADKVGTLTLLVAVGVFGFVALYDLSTAQYAALGTLGVVGALEVAHRQAQVELDKRRQELRDDRPAFDSIRRAHPRWKPKVIEQLDHSGLRFTAVGFDELQVAIAVAGPLCPACGRRLAERAQLRFAFLPRITFLCACGFEYPSKRTCAELVQEVREMMGVPG